MAQDALTAHAEIARVKFQLARYRRAEFGRSSEKLPRDIEQLEMALEALETDQAERLATASPAVAAAVQTAAEAQKPARRPLPEHLPREDLRHPAPCTCPSCGGALRKISNEVTETLDYVPGRFQVVRHIREKLSCRGCDTGVAAPAPDHAIARGGTIGSYRRVEVRRSSAALSSGRDLRPRRGEPGDLDPVRLGRSHSGDAEAAGRRPRRRHSRQRQPARRRYPGAGPRAGHRQDQDRPAVDLRPR